MKHTKSIKPNSVSNIVNIKRSSGIIQKAFINKNNYIGFYKTSNDNYKEIVGLSFNKLVF